LNERENRDRQRCSFCGKSQDQVHQLVAGPGVYICDQCIKLSQNVLHEDSPTATSKNPKTSFPLNPKTICSTLDQYVIGQEQAKRVLSVAVYNLWGSKKDVTRPPARAGTRSVGHRAEPTG
jgi:ATP-dependent Clp protease ATP-binding subunit ClpX